MKKNDYILILVLCTISISLFLVGKIFLKTTGDYVVVHVAGKETGRYPLTENTTIEISGKDDAGENVLVIKDGCANMIEADCPDKLCVHQKAISQNGESIICLPHQVIVTVETKEEAEIDAIVN